MWYELDDSDDSNSSMLTAKLHDSDEKLVKLHSTT